jgi:hypothetical protein
MIEVDNFKRSAFTQTLDLLQRYRLHVACIVIVLCFALANDTYAARKVAQRHKDLINGPRQAVDYSARLKKKLFEQKFQSDLTKRFLVDPKKSVAAQKSMLDVLNFQNDVCNQNTSFITSLPFADTGTTVGFTDNYDLTGDPTNCASPTCEATSGTFNDRGYTYAGTGTGPDVAYKIAFLQTTSLRITLDPSDAAPNADDLALMVYGPVCSNNPADAVVIADNSGDGNPPDVADNSEVITFTVMPAGIYNIVIDAYTYAGDPATAGPYTLNVACVPNLACKNPGYLIPPRREDESPN